MSAERDNNRVRTILGVNPSGQTQPLKVDSITARLLVNIKSVSSVSPSAVLKKRDNNRIPTLLGANGSGVKEARIDNRNNGLWATVTIE